MLLRLTAFAFLSIFISSGCAEDLEENYRVGLHSNTFEVSASLNTFTNHMNPHIGIGLWKMGGIPAFIRASGTAFGKETAVNGSIGYIIAETRADIGFFTAIQAGTSNYSGSYATSDGLGFAQGTYTGTDNLWHAGPQLGMLIGRFVTITGGLVYSERTRVGNSTGSIFGFPSGGPINEKRTGLTPVFSASVGYWF